MAVCKICGIRDRVLGSAQPVTCGKICIALFWGGLCVLHQESMNPCEFLKCLRIQFCNIKY